VFIVLRTVFFLLDLPLKSQTFPLAKQITCNMERLVGSAACTRDSDVLMQ
jgi:hypothetical protein